MIERLLAGLLLISPGLALADSLSLPGPALERFGTAKLVYHLDTPHTGTLDLDWTDGLGRLVDHQTIAVPRPSTAIDLSLDLRRAVTMRQTLHAVFTAGGTARPPVEASFVARPKPSGWADYEIIMWQDQPPRAIQTLQRAGLSGAKVYAKSGLIKPEDVASKVEGGLRFYLENIATDFFASYHIASSNALFEAAQALYAKDPASTAAFLRVPSLSDTAWQTRVANRLADTVRAMSVYRPLFYNLGDETGIADLAAAWDFDLSPASLSAMRQWLAQQYGTLDALNREWGTAFPAWDAVVPLLTSDALKRTDDNFAGWADFKAWMDVAYTRALRAATDAVHTADPASVAGIEGAQIPGWGGYDYGLLPNAVDLMEIYNFGANIEIARSVNPNLIILTTSFDTDAAERHRLWRDILLGARGHIIFDDQNGYASPDGAPGPRAIEAQGFYPELRGGVPAQLIASTPAFDPVAILYSQASFRTRWLLDRRAERTPWWQRKAETEYEDNAWRAALVRSADALAHLGIQPRFLASPQLERGVPDGVKLLILPEAIAMSAKETASVRRFVAGGGTVVATGDPAGVAVFDEHSRRLATSGLANLPGGLRRTDWLDRDRPRSETIVGLGALLHEAGIRPVVSLSHPDGTPVLDVTTRIFRNGSVLLLGLQRDAGADTMPETVRLHVAGASRWTDLQRHVAVHDTDRIWLDLDPVRAHVIAVSPAAVPAMVVSGPAAIRAGDVAHWQFDWNAAHPGRQPIVQVELRDPQDTVVPLYGGNVAVQNNAAGWTVPFALNDRPGEWTLRVSDMLSGQVVTRRLTLAR